MKLIVKKGNKPVYGTNDFEKDRVLILKCSQCNCEVVLELAWVLQILRFKWQNEEIIYPPQKGLKGGKKLEELVQLGFERGLFGWIHSIEKCLELTKIAPKEDRDYSDIDGKWADGTGLERIKKKEPENYNKNKLWIRDGNGSRDVWNEDDGHLDPEDEEAFQWALDND